MERHARRKKKCLGRESRLEYKPLQEQALEERALNALLKALLQVHGKD